MRKAQQTLWRCAGSRAITAHSRLSFILILDVIYCVLRFKRIKLSFLEQVFLHHKIIENLQNRNTIETLFTCIFRRRRLRRREDDGRGGC